MTATGTIRLDFEVLDSEPFDALPGQFVAVDLDRSSAYRRSPYCLLDAADRRFSLLVRVVPQGPVSLFLADLIPGDVIGFRGPTGRSMLPRGPGLVTMIATGVGLAPCLFLANTLLREGIEQPLELYWGLRLSADICLTDQLDLLVDQRGLRYRISLSSPPPDWRGLKGRVTETVPPLLRKVSRTWFYLVSNGRMVAEMRHALEEVGVESGRIYCESFFDHRYRPDPATVDAILHRFRSDETAPMELLRLVESRRR